MLIKDDFPLYALNANDKNSFQAKVKILNNEFIYELKIPLAANKLSKYIFEANPKDEILCKIETGTLERNMTMDENRPPRQGTGTNIPGGTGRRSGSGADGTGMGQRRPGGGANFNSSSDKLDLEFKVILN